MPPLAKAAFFRREFIAGDFFVVCGKKFQPARLRKPDYNRLNYQQERIGQIAFGSAGKKMFGSRVPEALAECSLLSKTFLRR